MPSTFIGPEGLDELGIGSPRAIKSGSLLQPYPLNSIAADPTPTDSVVWDGGGADDDWTSAHNWNPDVIPNADDILHFAGTTRLSPVNDYGVAHAFAGIEFDAGAGAFTLGGNSITLNGNIFNESDNNQVINNDLIVNAARDITSTNPTCGETRLNGDISGTGGLTISSANNTQFVLVYGNNSFTGPLVMRDCYCVFNTFANGGVPCALGAQSSDPANIVLFNDVIDVYFQYTGPTVSTDRGMAVTGSYGSGVFAIDVVGTVVTFNGVIAGDNILQIQTADLVSCAVVLTGANTIVSVEPGYDGQVKFSSVSDIGTPCNIGIGTEMSAGIYSNGVLEYTGPTASTNKVLAGSGTFRITSSGVLTLTGTGTHTGVIEINSGTLQFGDGGATGSSVNSVSIVNNSALIFHTSSDQLYSATIISGSGTLTKRGATSAITLYGVNTYTGATYVEDGTLQIGNTLVDGSINNSASIAVSSGGVLTFSPVSSGGTYPNVISGLGMLAKAGVGTMILSGTNTYTGTTTIYDGTLQITGSLANTAVTVSVGTLLGRSVTGASATITGAVTVANSATAIIQPGSFGDNVLNTGALTFGGSSARLTVNSTTTTMSKVNVTGTVALGGCGIILPAGITTSGTYKVITASSTMSGTLPTIVTNNTGRFCFVQQTANDLEIVVGWTPADITTAAWYDAADASTIVESGGFVSQWNDKSGNSLNLAQAVGADQPVTGTRTINGVNAFDFDGISDYILRGSGMPDGDVMVFGVFNADLIGGNVFANGGSGGSKSRQYISDSFVDFGNASLSFSPVLSAGQPYVVMGQVNDLGDLSVQGYRIDGGALATGGTQRATAQAEMAVGANAGGIAFFNGVIGEVVVVNSLLSDSDRQKIEGYLAWKWGGI